MNKKDADNRSEINETISEESKAPEESNAARRLRMTGEGVGSDVDCTDLPTDLKSKLSNFWYHHKAKVLITAFFTFVITVVVVQFTGQSNPDVFILYAGPDYIATLDNQNFCKAVREVMTEDYNGDGEKKIRLTDVVFSTDAQMEAAKAEAAAKGEEYAFDGMLNKNNSDRFTYEVFGDNAIICILSWDQYEMVRSANGFVPLSEIFGATEVKGAVDEWGIRFSETNFYEFYKNTHIFPEDAVLALRKPSTISAITGRDKIEKVHAYHVELFKRIADFRFPEGYQPK